MNSIMPTFVPKFYDSIKILSSVHIRRSEVMGICELLDFWQYFSKSKISVGGNKTVILRM